MNSQYLYGTSCAISYLFNTPKELSITEYSNSDWKYCRYIFVIIFAWLIIVYRAEAATVTFNFTVTATSGSLSGQSSTGFFSFDDSIIPSGGGLVRATGLLTNLSFEWNSITYDTSTANTGFFDFGSSGDFDACFGTNASAGGCSAGAHEEIWYVALSKNGGGFFNYATPNDYVSDGTVSYSLVENVPLPASLPLLITGLVVTGFVALRRKLAC